jgi:hypothetical protein
VAFCRFLGFLSAHVALAGARIYFAVLYILIVSVVLMDLIGERESERERERCALYLEALVVCMEALEVCRCFF